MANESSGSSELNRFSCGFQRLDHLSSIRASRCKRLLGAERSSSHRWRCESCSSRKARRTTALLRSGSHALYRSVIVPRCALLGVAPRQLDCSGVLPNSEPETPATWSGHARTSDGARGSARHHAARPSTAGLPVGFHVARAAPPNNAPRRPDPVARRRARDESPWYHSSTESSSSGRSRSWSGRRRYRSIRRTKTIVATARSVPTIAIT